MYVIPRDRMPATLPAAFGEINDVSRDELKGLLQAVRALPSPPGALMGWDHDLIHWGSMSTGRSCGTDQHRRRIHRTGTDSECR